MLRKLLCGSGVLLLLLAVAAGAQAPGRGRRGLFQMGPRIVSPQVNPDGTITVRLYAPQAKTVVATGELDGKVHPMHKAPDGVWSVTIGPLAPNVYNYQFRVDGVLTTDPLDPAVKLGFGPFPSASLVEVPVPGKLTFDDAQQVPHGQVRLVTYYSNVIGAPRTMWVYTPPGYSHSQQRYPVFYLLHGAAGTDSSWVLTGRENYIMDNLIASGQAKPMIIVNPLVYPSEGIGVDPVRPRDLAALGLAGPPPGARRGARGRGGRGGGLLGAGEQNGPFARDLLDVVIPYVDSHFRTLADPNDRALGGLSMGGGATIAIGFTHTNLFHTLVIMSAGAQNAAAAYPAFFQDPAQTNSTLKLLWLGVGSIDPLAGAGARALNATLTAHGIHHDWWLLPGGRHEWVVWRHALDTVAPLMFR